MELMEHSPLGASGASRWIPCPGSVRLSFNITDDNNEYGDNEYGPEGSAAHAVARQSLVTNKEAWHLINYKYSPVNDVVISEDNYRGGIVLVTKDMVDAVQVYLDAIEVRYPNRNQGNSAIEDDFHCPELHEFFYGRSDFWYYDEAKRTLHVWDYKHGVGIVIEAKWNSQGLYYACGVLTKRELWGKVDKVVIHIAQPRGFHPDGPIRSWAIGIWELENWLDSELLPAMDRALTSNATASGEHCRFCPARGHGCPQLEDDMEELKEMMELREDDAVARISNKDAGRFLDLYDLAKIRAKAVNEVAYSRSQAGQKVPGRKLVTAKVNRAWKDEAEKALVKKFKGKAYEDKKLKSPAQIERMAGGLDAAAEYAYKPNAGLQLVKDSEKRRAVNRDTKSMFKAEAKKRKKK